MKKNLSGVQKVAVLFLALGESIASELLKHLDSKETGRVLKEIQSLGRVQAEEVQKVLEEFSHALQDQKQSLKGGHELVQSFLSYAFKEDHSLRANDSFLSTGLDAIEGVNALQIVEAIKEEHPQTIALILACCEASQAGYVLKGLPESMHTELLKRMASLGAVSPEILAEINATLKERLEKKQGQTELRRGGKTQVAAMLSKLNHEEAENYLHRLEESDPVLAEAIRQEMFMFSDLEELLPEDLKNLFDSVAQKVWLIALRGCEESFVEKICKLMSKRAAILFQEDFIAMKPVKRTEVIAAQKNILSQFRVLENNGQIIGKNTKMI